MCQGDARLPLEEQTITKYSQGGKEGKSELPGRQRRPLTPEEKALQEGAGLALRANGMPGFPWAKMEDVPADGRRSFCPKSHIT